MAAKLEKSSLKSKSDSDLTVKRKVSHLPPSNLEIGTGLDDLYYHPKVELPLVNFYDVEIKIGDKVLQAHRAHLTQHSSYFEKIFDQNKLPFVALDLDPALNIAAPMFEMILQWMYTGKTQFRMKDLDDVLKVAERLGMKGLRVCCNQFLLDLFESRGPMAVYELAVNSRFEGIKCYAMKYACRNFVRLTREYRFLQYSKLQVINLLSDDHLAIPSEKLVFDAAVAWLKAEWRTRRVCLSQIMACVRFSAMSLEELKECCRPQDGFIVKNSAVIGQFFKAFLFRVAQLRGRGMEYESFGESSSKCRTFSVATAELQHFTSRQLYQSLFDAHQGSSEAPLRRTKSSIL